MNLPIELIFYDVYEAMEDDESDEDYLANVVLAALQTMRCTTFPEVRENYVDSEYFREEGNRAYKNGLLQKALVNYNKAMAYAPNGSLGLKLAYSNRSAVLFTAKEYKACQKDCIKALDINCPTPTKLIEKLEKRITQCKIAQKNNSIPFQQDKICFRNYADEFFKLNSRNSDIPCASSDVDVRIESGIPKVIAKRDIAPGVLVGLEKAFVTWAPNKSVLFYSCYYCRKLALNLFPCDGCVSAMFCSQQCQENCMAEYHTIECKIAGFLNGISPSKRWIVQVMLKVMNMCSSWDEFISMSYDYGCARIKKSTVNDIYDGANPSSVFTFYKDRNILHGALFNSAIGSAYCLNFLQNLQSFLPEDWERKILATKAMARFLMYLSLFVTSNLLPLVTNNVTNNSIEVHCQGHLGLFPFVGKLKHSCMPNLQILVMNNTIGLVALEQIKAGTELTVSHVCHWLDNNLNTNQRKLQMFLNDNTVCTCLVCSASPDEHRKKTKLTTAQKRAVQECFTLDTCRNFDIPIDKCFEQIYKALTLLHNIQFSEDYIKVYKMLKQLQLYALANKVDNNVLSRDF